MDERKDHHSKYPELGRYFQLQANEVHIASRQSLRTLEAAAKFIQKQKPKTPEEFERNEFLGDFILKTAILNDKTLELLAYLQTFCDEVQKDYEAVAAGVSIRNQLRDQSDTIEVLIQQREALVNLLYDSRKNQINP